MQLSDKHIEVLKKDARRTHPMLEDTEGEEIVVDYVGSHVDDAYDMGKDHGETAQARYVLTALGIDWND